MSPHWLNWVGRVGHGLLRVSRRIHSWVTSFLLRVGGRISEVTGRLWRVDCEIGRIAFRLMNRAS